MDEAINTPIGKFLFDSKENIQLFSEVSRSSQFEQFQETNFHITYKKNYGIKNRQECLYEDLSKIQKQLALLSDISCGNRTSTLNCCLKNSRTMLPENLDSVDFNHKRQPSPDSTEKSHSIAKNECIKEIEFDNFVTFNKTPLTSTTEEQNFSNKKPEFSQLTQSAQLAFILSKFSDDSNDSDNKVSENIVSKVSFPRSEPRKKTDQNDCINDDADEDNDKDKDVHEGREGKSLKFNHLNYKTFEFEGDYSKDSDSSGLFEFSLEGEKIVSSLCGPQTKTVDKGNKEERTESNTLFISNTPSQGFNCLETLKEKSAQYKTNNSPVSKYLDIGMSFSNAVTSTPEKDSTDSINKNNIAYNDMKAANNPQGKTKKLDKTTIENENRFAGGDKLTIETNPNEMKCVILQQMSTNCVEMRSGATYGTWMIGRIRPLENKGTKNEICNSHMDNTTDKNLINNFIQHSPQQKEKSEDISKTSKSASVPNIFSMLSKFNQGDNSSIVPNSTSINQHSETKSEILDICDDEISFRKSAIKGCLVFERIIKDLNIATQEQDLENYCKIVKRCVSVASSSEKHEFKGLMSQLISGFLKLADSWGILNSYFGETGNYGYTPQNLDDINFYKSFQDWQIKSKTLLDHLTAVVQNLKEFIPKPEEKETKLFKRNQIPALTEYNPFLNSIESRNGTINAINKIEMSNNVSHQPQQKEENIKNLTSSPLQFQEIQFPKNIVNIFTAHNQNNNWKPNISESNQQKPTEVFWDLPQNNPQQNTFNSPSISERKLRKKWNLTVPDYQSETQCSTIPPSQGITMQQNHGSTPIPTLNFQYVAQNKGPMESMMMPPFNFFGNQYSSVPHSIQNIRENTAYNYGRLPTYFPNIKQSPKRKGNFKPEEHLHKEIMSNNPVFNRVNLCNPQISMPLLQNNVNPNPFGMMEEPKNSVIYQNFCIGDGKALTANNPYGGHFFHNEVYQPSPISNQPMFCHKTCESKPVMTLPLNNGDSDDSSEEYYPIKSYMKPGSYRVPNKSKSLMLQTSNNLNYIFDDILVTGITVPFTKTNIFSQSKKTTNKSVSTIEKSIQTNRPDEVKNTDSVWKAALASAEVLGKSLMCKQDEKNQFDNGNSHVKDLCKIKEPNSDGINKITENNQIMQPCLTETLSDQTDIQNKQTEPDAVKPTAIKTDDWLIQSFSKLEGQSETKNEFPGLEIDKISEVENITKKISDSSKAQSSSNTTKNESDESDNTTNDFDSEIYSGKERGSQQKKEKNNLIKQKLPSSIKSVSILQKPREYCQSRAKPWDKARDFSYQISSHKGDTRNLHKNPANWIKYNRKCINRQTLFKLQDILSNLSKIESNNTEIQKEVGHRNEMASKVININAINYKLKSHMYENIDQILIDIRQMFANSRDSNKEHSNVIELTSKLEILFNELVEKHFGRADLSDNRESGNPSGTSLAMKTRRAQKVQRKIN